MDTTTRTWCKVADLDDLPPKDALAHRGPALVEIVTDPELV